MFMKKFFLCISIFLFIYAIFNIFNWINDSNSIAKENKEILNTVISNNTIESKVDDSYTNQSSIDFTPLKQLNNDVVRMDKS